jgi:hypothetical protein
VTVLVRAYHIQDTHTSAYVSIRQHTRRIPVEEGDDVAVLVRAYLIQEVRDVIKRHQRPRGSTYTSAYVSIRQHTHKAYVSIRI